MGTLVASYIRCALYCIYGIESSETSTAANSDTTNTDSATSTGSADDDDNRLGEALYDAARNGVTQVAERLLTRHSDPTRFVNWKDSSCTGVSIHSHVL